MNGSKFLHADYSIECGTDGWDAKMTLAMASVFMYALGIPAGYAYLLYNKREHMYTEVTQHDEGAFFSEYDSKWYVMDEELADQLGFLYAAYEPACW